MNGRPWTQPQPGDRTTAADERAALNLAAGLLGSLPQLLRGERIRRGLTQQAAAGQVGVNEASWKRWETGRNSPQRYALAAVLRWLAADPRGRP